MKISSKHCLLSMLLAATPPLLAFQERVEFQDAHTSEATSLSQGSSRPQLIMEDLQGVVVLCATEPGSPAFEKAWVAYVRNHVRPETDIDALVKDVTRRAKAWRKAMFRQHPQRQPEAFGSMSAVARMMHDTAKAVISNVR